ncbi:MAG: ribonuclease Z [Hyperthermus sp.]|nr:MAG: ribonuclease Z [Hyperthermus sp.]
MQRLLGGRLSNTDSGSEGAPGILLAKCYGRWGLQAGLVFLGSGAAVPRNNRGLPGLAFINESRIVLLDAGEGVQKALDMAGLSASKIIAILVTHLHGDHVLGLPGLLQSMAMLGRSKPLVLIGPRGLGSLVEEVAKLTLWLPPYPIEVVEARAWERIRLPGGIEVLPYPVNHRGVEAFGYRLWEAPRKPKIDLDAARRLGLEPGPILGMLQRGLEVRVNGRVIRPSDVVRSQHRISVSYTGDTAPSHSVVEASRNVDVLVHDATFASDMAEEAHNEGHSTALDAARAAREAAAKILVLTHFSARYTSPEPLVWEAKRIFPNTYPAIDGAKLVLRP